ncbi:hypothetical protein M2266_002627 [Streptomyces sp. SPB162]|nr:hypothetical protein [Streptomyces sp. SPB162]
MRTGPLRSRAHRWRYNRGAEQREEIHRHRSGGDARGSRPGGLRRPAGHPLGARLSSIAHPVLGRHSPPDADGHAARHILAGPVHAARQADAARLVLADRAVRRRARRTPRQPGDTARPGGRRQGRGPHVRRRPRPALDAADTGPARPAPREGHLLRDRPERPGPPRRRAADRGGRPPAVRPLRAPRRAPELQVRRLQPARDPGRPPGDHRRGGGPAPRCPTTGRPAGTSSRGYGR